MSSYGSISQVVRAGVEYERHTMSLADRLHAYDLTWSTKLYHRFGRERTPRLCWEIFSHSGDGFLWILTIPPVTGLLWVSGLIGPFDTATKVLLSVLSTVMVVDILAIMLLKAIFHRQRPPFHQVDVRFVGPDQHSFPSGHSTRVWAMVAMLVYLSKTHPWILHKFGFGLSPAAVVGVSIVWALIINFSRVALGRHYPTDVLAGTLIGYFVFWPISLFLVKYFGLLDMFLPLY
uniref:Phosphatidic acid phosphatase type 2/haloperoxidase domain-containing protein n=1 Tax=Hyaloperonospora arabidopsidis (strain Emoy2) TaxID=559515 RepID=M4C0W8_HYAAE